MVKLAGGYEGLASTADEALMILSMENGWEGVRGRRRCNRKEKRKPSFEPLYVSDARLVYNGPSYIIVK